jgi:hypothetical protein
MMPLPEKLSREVERLTVMRERLRAMGSDSAGTLAAIALLAAIIEAAHKAAGRGEAAEMVSIVKHMEGFMP